VGRLVAGVVCLAIAVCAGPARAADPDLVGTIPVPVGVGYAWGDALPKLMVFDCDYGRYRDTAQARIAQAGGVRSFRLPSGLPSAMFRLIGSSGAPDATLTGPRREMISTAAPPGDANVVVIHAGDGRETLVALKRPSAGTWRVTPVAGSTPLASVAVAQGLPASKVTARVTGRGARRTLTYTARTAPGRTITFAERGAHAGRLLGTAHGASGHIAFSPSGGPAEKRTIVAYVDPDGAPARATRVASFRWSGPPHLRPPGALRATRRGTLATVHWKPVAGATRYAVTLVTRTGGRRMVLTRRTTARLRLPSASARATVAVNAIAAGNLRGPAGRVVVRTTKRRR
jgi:hypothetical protein